MYALKSVLRNLEDCLRSFEGFDLNKYYLQKKSEMSRNKLHELKFRHDNCQHAVALLSMISSQESSKLSSRKRRNLNLCVVSLNKIHVYG